MNPVLKSYYDQLEWHPVSSSNVREIAYQPDLAYLWVRFKSGGVYLYEQVPPGIWHGFLAVPSKGQYVWAILRNKGKDDRYPYRGPFRI